MYTELVEAFEKLTYEGDKGQCTYEGKLLFPILTFYDQVVIRACLIWFLPESDGLSITARMQLLKLLPFIFQLAALILIK